MLFYIFYDGVGYVMFFYFSDRIMLLLFCMKLSYRHKDMIFKILCVLLKVTRCDVGSAEVISARAITGVHAGYSIKFGVIEASRHSCALVLLYHALK